MAMKCSRLPTITKMCQMPCQCRKTVVEDEEDDAHRVADAAGQQPAETGATQGGEQRLDRHQHDPAHHRVDHQ